MEPVSSLLDCVPRSLQEYFQLVVRCTAHALKVGSRSRKHRHQQQTIVTKPKTPVPRAITTTTPTNDAAWPTLTTNQPTNQPTNHPPTLTTRTHSRPTCRVLGFNGPSPSAAALGRSSTSTSRRSTCRCLERNAGSSSRRRARRPTNRCGLGGYAGVRALVYTGARARVRGYWLRLVFFTRAFACA